MSPRLRADLTLLLTAVIWGSAFAAQRAAAELGAFWFNALRFGIGWLLLGWLARRGKDAPTPSALPWRAVFWLSLALFAGSALQQAGLRYTTAANAGFITSLYVVIIPLLQAAWLGERPRPVAWLAALLGASGMALLGAGPDLISGAGFSLQPGDALELAGAFAWALHIILLGRLAPDGDTVAISRAQFLAAGLLHLGAALLFERQPAEALLANLGALWQMVVYVGVFSTAIGYTLQIAGQRHAPPLDAALILSLEAVFAGVFGWLFLRETLEGIQVLGALLALAAAVLAAIASARLIAARSQESN